MPAFFIERPVFAWVIALLILLVGGLAVSRLGIEQYPNVAPPRLSIVASYPGASAVVVERTVTALIEQELNGIPGLLYFSSSSSEGTAEINLALQPGTSIALAAVEVQDRLKRVEERLPDSVRREGILVDRGGESDLLFVALTADNTNVDPVWLGDYATRVARPALLRIAGVGSVEVYSPQYAMRIWPSVHRLTALGVTTTELVAAIEAQNQRLTLGSVGSLPAPPNTALTVPMSVAETLQTPEDFGAIALRVNPDGSALRLRDLARVELGGSTYSYPAFLDGLAAAAISVKLAAGANALRTAEAVKTTLAGLAASFPPGLHAHTAFDSSGYVKLSLIKVGYTLLEAMALVVLVMLVFLRSWRATLIPALVVPIALIGSCAALLALGFSLNVLSLFGMVLAIGILVDDAIVVVENVERLMHQQGLDARTATHEAMGQISGAVVAITLVLTAVFVPMAFFPGAVGAVYRQFAVVLAVSMALSAFLALSLTPALCALLLRPHRQATADRTERLGLAMAQGYRRTLGSVLTRPLRLLLLYMLLCALLAWLYLRLPGAFVPNEDKGTFATVILLPTGTPQHVTQEVVDEVQAYLRRDPNVVQTFGLLGFSYFGGNQNAGMIWPTLRDWTQRPTAADGADGLIERLNAHFAHGTARYPQAQIQAFNTPPLPAMGRRAGLDMRLQDRAGSGHAALFAAKDRLLTLAAHEPALRDVTFTGQEDTAQLEVSLDRVKAQSMGVSLAEINDTLSTLYGSRYVGDFIQDDQVRQIIVQADGRDRQSLDSLAAARVRNAKGDMVPLSAFLHLRWTLGPQEIDHFNGFPALPIAASPAPGYSTSQAMAALARLTGELRLGFAYDWVGQSYQEQVSGDQTPLLFALSLLVIFLCLAALYESWAIPFAVLLAIPLGILGAVLASTLRGLPNDLYFRVGLITVMGLTAKNAILIIEVAQQLIRNGGERRQAILEAASLRLRPILMTSLAFMLGVLPLVLAHGAGSASQRALGTAVFGGMLSATLLTIVFVPLLYAAVTSVKRRHPPAKD